MACCTSNSELNTIFDMRRENSIQDSDAEPLLDSEWEAALGQIKIGRLQERAGWITYLLWFGAFVLIFEYDDAISRWTSKMFGIPEVVVFYLSLGMPWAFFTMRHRLYRWMLRRAWRDQRPWHKR